MITRCNDSINFSATVAASTALVSGNKMMNSSPLGRQTQSEALSCSSNVPAVTTKSSSPADELFVEPAAVEDSGQRIAIDKLREPGLEALVLGVGVVEGA